MVADWSDLSRPDFEVLLEVLIFLKTEAQDFDAILDLEGVDICFDTFLGDGVHGEVKNLLRVVMGLVIFAAGGRVKSKIQLPPSIVFQHKDEVVEATELRGDESPPEDTYEVGEALFLEDYLVACPPCSISV